MYRGFGYDKFWVRSEFMDVSERIIFRRRRREKNCGGKYYIIELECRFGR